MPAASSAHSRDHRRSALATAVATASLASRSSVPIRARDAGCTPAARAKARSVAGDFAIARRTARLCGGEGIDNNLLPSLAGRKSLLFDAQPRSDLAKGRFGRDGLPREVTAANANLPALPVLVVAAALDPALPNQVSHALLREAGLTGRLGNGQLLEPPMAEGLLELRGRGRQTFGALTSAVTREQGSALTERGDLSGDEDFDRGHGALRELR